MWVLGQALPSLRDRSTDDTAYNPGCIGPCGDLHEWDLSGLPLKFVNLTGANLRHAMLVRTDFYAASLQGADLTSAVLVGAMMQGTVGTYAIFDHANLYSVQFADAHMRYASFRNANMVHVWWAESEFHHADFRSANTSRPWNSMFMDNMMGGSRHDERTAGIPGGLGWGDGERLVERALATGIARRVGALGAGKTKLFPLRIPEGVPRLTVVATGGVSVRVGLAGKSGTSSSTGQLELAVIPGRWWVELTAPQATSDVMVTAVFGR